MQRSCEKVQDGGDVDLKGPVVCLKKFISAKKNGIFSHVLWLCGMEVICRGELLINGSDS